MWSLPDITRMNAVAAKEAPSLEQQIRTGIGSDGEKLECYCSDWSGGPCEGELYHYLWYDIFSDDPKGILTICETHDGYFGSPTEGYFTCKDCERVMIENYTWENYYTIVDDCTMLCLPCAAERYIADEDNWIELTDENIAAVDFDRIRRAKHVIGVRMPTPKGITFFDNAEFDSMDGHRISGGGIQELLHQAKDQGETKALLIVDAGYQFAVSIGVYIPEKEGV